MAAVRARFYIGQVTQLAGGNGTVQLNAVIRGEENKKWASYTPSGQLSMNLSREAGPALDWFLARLGQEVFLDISDAAV